MVAEKGKEFRMYSSEEEIARKKEKTWTISLRVNAKEQAMIKELRRMLNLNMDGTAFKIAAKVGYNVLHSTFGADILAYLTSKTRRREIQE